MLRLLVDYKTYKKGDVIKVSLLLEQKLIKDKIGELYNVANKSDDDPGISIRYK